MFFMFRVDTIMYGYMTIIDHYHYRCMLVSQSMARRGSWERLVEVN